MKIGIFGGTFDPPHKGHELFLKSFITEYRPDKMLVIPTKIPPHKACETTSAEHRLKMAKLAFKGIAEIEDCELKRHGQSYTADTLSYLKKKYPNDELYFIIGSDMLFTFKNWYKPELISSLATVVAAPRINDAALVSQMEQTAKEYEKKFGGKFEIFKMAPLEISSTGVREGKTLEISESVLRYIKENGLYEESEEIKRIKEILSRRLSPKRYYHSLGVMNTAGELARIYGEDVERAKIAGLVHDCTKELKINEHLEIVEKYGIKIPEAEKNIEKLYHSKTGAVMARILFGIEDEEILKAIECHTAGKAKMTRFEKILFLADFIDPSRTYKGVSAIRKKAFKNLEEAIMECVSFTVIDLAKRGKSIAPNTFETYNDIVSELEKQKTKGDFYGKNI